MSNSFQDTWIAVVLAHNLLPLSLAVQALEDQAAAQLDAKVPFQDVEGYSWVPRCSWFHRRAVRGK